MKYALIIAEIAQDLPHDKQQALKNYEGYCIDMSVNNESVTMLNPYTYLFELAGGLLPLSRCITQAESWNITTRTLFFDQEPLWIISKIQ